MFCCRLLVILLFLFRGFPLSPGAYDKMRYIIVELPGGGGGLLYNNFESTSGEHLPTAVIICLHLTYCKIGGGGDLKMSSKGQTVLILR